MRVNVVILFMKRGALPCGIIKLLNYTECPEKSHLEAKISDYRMFLFYCNKLLEFFPRIIYLEILIIKFKITSETLFPNIVLQARSLNNSFVINNSNI